MVGSRQSIIEAWTRTGCLSFGWSESCLGFVGPNSPFLRPGTFRRKPTTTYHGTSTNTYALPQAINSSSACFYFFTLENFLLLHNKSLPHEHLGARIALCCLRFPVCSPQRDSLARMAPRAEKSQLKRGRVSKRTSTLLPEL